MGDIADAALQDGFEQWLEEGCPPLHHAVCKNCGAKYLQWVRHQGRWALADDYGLHTCPPPDPADLFEDES